MLKSIQLIGSVRALRSESFTGTGGAENTPGTIAKSGAFAGYPVPIVHAYGAILFAVAPRRIEEKSDAAGRTIPSSSEHC
jgi:hypothetical protein